MKFILNLTAILWAGYGFGLTLAVLVNGSLDLVLDTQTIVTTSIAMYAIPALLLFGFAKLIKP